MISCLLVARDVDGSSRVVKVSVHLRKPEDGHDLVEQNVVQVDAVLVSVRLCLQEFDDHAVIGAGGRRLRNQNGGLNQKYN